MASRIKNQKKNPLDYLNDGPTASLVMTPASPEEFIKLILKLDTKKASGSDKISNYIIKLSKNVLAPILSSLFNSCIHNGIFPDIYKVAEVIPLFKGGDRCVLGNYRPISLLPHFGKLFEKVIAKRLNSFY